LLRIFRSFEATIYEPDEAWLAMMESHAGNSMPYPADGTV